jgi:hypothetical protein
VEEVTLLIPIKTLSKKREYDIVQLERERERERARERVRERKKETSVTLS